jgi:cytochrome c2
LLKDEKTSLGVFTMKQKIQELTFPLLMIGLIFMSGLLLSGCSEIAAAAGLNREADMVIEMPGGDPERGEAAIRAYGCDACHTIPGIKGANATVGPPLDDWADRRYIAGALTNKPDNLLAWIQDPQAIEPGTAMPDVGVTEQDARDIGAYLYTLSRDD